MAKKQKDDKGTFKYWSPKKILEYDAKYYIIFGERSNGKTTGVLRYMLEEYVKSDYTNQCALIRRWGEDFKGRLGTQMVEGINALDWVSDITNGKYTHIKYNASRWYLCHVDEEGEILERDKQPWMFAFSLASDEHYKGTTYPNITNILFDEFITRDYYLPDEFLSFQNVVSSIVRQRNNVKIFMCANTINKYCPYFYEMGLTNVKNQKKDTIEVYKYGESGLKVAVEYTFSGGKKESNVYFAFNNPKLQMITSGDWEISIYPHLPCKFTKLEIKGVYYVIFDDEILQCNIIYSKQLKSMFTYIHRKTTQIKDPDKDIVFSKEFNARKNWYRFLNHPVDNVTKLIYDLVNKEKLFYQDNTVGETMRNYLIWCTKNRE